MRGTVPGATGDAHAYLEVVGNGSFRATMMLHPGQASQLHAAPDVEFAFQLAGIDDGSRISAAFGILAHALVAHHHSTRSLAAILLTTRIALETLMTDKPDITNRGLLQGGALMTLAR
jgi:hypothetical protein